MAKRGSGRSPSVFQVGNSLGGGAAKDGDQYRPPTRDFGVLKVRSAKLKQSQAQIIREDGTTSNRRFERMDNEAIVKIVKGSDLEQIRALSKYFVQANGMYARAVRYLADIYRFDFMVYPNLDLDVELEESFNKKVLKKFNEVLEHFDATPIQLMCRKWATQVCTDGVYYGYVCDDINDRLTVQDLPVNYCRSRFTHQGRPVIEFCAEYFDKVARDEITRDRILNLFPEEIRKGYASYKAGQLPAEAQGERPGWMLLDVHRAFKFNFYESDLPPFLNAIPALLDLAEVQDLEKEKLLQELQKILIQTFALDKNGQLPFTMTELQRLNQNAIDMVGDAVGVSVLSTVANVHLEELASDTEDSSTSTKDSMNNVYSEFGISTNLFNTDGNLALEKSIGIDAAFVKQLMLQFEFFLNDYIAWRFNKPALKFRLKMLATTIFNNQELSSRYQDLTEIGFSRFLPMIALGHTQKEVCSMVKLEQQIMSLDNWMIPPFSSNTMSSETWAQIKQVQQGTLDATELGVQPAVTTPSAGGSSSDKSSSSGASVGRKELPDEQKSEKTIANRESTS